LTRGYRWYAELGAGYATSLDDPARAPGGGPFVNALVARRISRLVLLGLSLGWHEYVDGEGPKSPSDCPPAPGPACVRSRAARERALEATAALRLQPSTGRWRPYAMATTGLYRFTERVQFLGYDSTGEVLVEALPPEVIEPYTGWGWGLGIGVIHRPGSAAWSIAGGARVHGVLAGDAGWSGNSWVQLGVGVGRSF
jgi:hypothetical protein